MSLPSPGTTVKVTRHLRHLQPPPRTTPRKRGSNIVVHTPAYVQPHDRIAFWNIVPGDVVKMRTGRIGQDLGLDPTKKQRGEGRVHSIDRERNLAWLDHLSSEDPRAPMNKRSVTLRWLDPSKPEEGLSPNYIPVRRPVHYSNLMLKIPNTNAWAHRVYRKKLHYDKKSRAFRWQRFAVYKDQNGENVTVQIDWPKNVTVSRNPAPDSTLVGRVQEESWLPWNPEDPVLLPSERPRDSPASVAELARLAQAKLQAGVKVEGVSDEVRQQRIDEVTAALKTGDHKQVTAALNKAAREQQLTPSSSSSSRGSKTTYAGFQVRSRPKPPPVAQLPSPAELLSLAKTSMAAWVRRQAIQEHIQNGGQTFAADDYLALAPQAGPAAGGSWRMPITTTSSEATSSGQSRDAVTGQLLYQQAEDGTPLTSRRHLDTMPVELLMAGDLTNPQGTKWRMRRYKERKALEATKRAAEEKRTQKNLRAFKAYVEEKKLEREAEEAAGAGEQEA